jgi:MFS family permease
VFYFLTLFIQNTLRFSPLQAGLAFLAMTVPLFGAARVTPKLLARFGAKPVTTAGTVLITIAMLWLTQLTDTSTFAGSLLGPLLLIGVGVGLTFMPLNAIILSTVAPRDTGSASGLLQAMQRIGSSVGLAVLVAVAATGHSLASQAARAYLAAAILSAFALLVTLFVIKPRKRAA